jgi:hypothetical protein
MSYRRDRKSFGDFCAKKRKKTGYMPSRPYHRHKAMTLLPLHVAFVWMLKVHPRMRWLSFAALTVGALVPDVEVLFSYLFGLSVFCGWDFPCTLAPDRLVLHSFLGALTLDAILTLFFVKVIGLMKPERFGIFGFSNIKFNWQFYLSAAIGSLSHVVIDWLHHAANPIFWPLMLGQPASYYVDGLLLPFMSAFAASFAVAIIGSALMIFLAIRALADSNHSFTELIFNPKMAISLISKSLTIDR